MRPALGHEVLGLGVSVIRKWIQAWIPTRAAALMLDAAGTFIGLLHPMPGRFTRNIKDLYSVRITQPMKRQQQLSFVIPYRMEVRRRNA